MADKKKILFITYLEMTGYGGGFDGARKYYDSLRFWAEKNGYEFKIIALSTLNDSLLTPRAKTKGRDILARLLGHSSHMYLVWGEIRSKVIDFDPSVVFLGQSRLGFIAKDLKRSLPACKIITAVENIEVDYVEGYFATTKGRLAQFFKAIEKRNVLHDEGAAFRFSDALQFLSERDLNRATELYSISKEVVKYIVPVCLPEQSSPLCISGEKKTFVFFGSMDQATNIEAALFLIEKVWIPFFKDLQAGELIIAGKKIPRKITELVSGVSNCAIVENYKKISDFLPQGSTVVVPIKNGAGMKVKIAESLSLGLSIIGSKEALVGYEAAIAQDRWGAIVLAETPEEYRDAMLELMQSETRTTDISEQNKKMFQSLYSYKAARSLTVDSLDVVLGPLK